MASRSVNGKVKLLDTSRSNTLPKYITSGDNDLGRSSTRGPTASDIQQMLLESKGSEGDILQNHPEMSQRMETANQDQRDIRKAREKEIFLLDRNPLDTFALPGKPESSVMLPAKQTKAVKVRKLKVTEISQEDPGPTTEVNTVTPNQFSFLATAMGIKDEDVEFGEGMMESKVDFSGSKTAPAKGQTDRPAGGGQTADLDEASAILSGLETGEDAINFFARFGSDSGVKFVHLEEVNDPKEFRPYDLVRIEGPVPEHSPYYTMSPAGITHCTPGENSECIPLASWMRHSMLFKILRNIGFYKYFLHRKVFNAWKDNVRFLLFAKQRKAVSSRLYMARKTTTSAIMSIKRHLMGVQSVRLLYLDGRTLEKDDFVEQQTQNCVKSGTLFEEAMRNVTQEVQTVIHQIQNMHSRANVDPNTTAVAYSDDVPEKHKSLLKLRQEKTERMQMRKQAKLEYATLPDFIRFIDYLAVEALVSIAITTLHAFYEDLVKQRKTGIFETTLRFNTEGTFFSPTCLELQDAVDRLIEIMVNSVGNLNRVAYLNNKVNNSGGASIQSMVRNDRKFCETVQKIKDRLALDFDRADEHAHSFDSVRPIYDFNASWDFAAYKAENHDMGDLKGMMEMIGEWTKELEKLRNRPIGVLEIDSKRLKNELNPLREARLHEIKDYIKELAKSKCMQLLDIYKEHLSKLNNKPSQLKDFAGQVGIITGMREEEKKLFKQAFSVDQMYAMLQQHDVQIPPEDIVFHEDLHDKQQQYRTEIDAAQAFKDTKLAEMISNVDSNIIKLEDQVITVGARLDDSDFTETNRFDEAEHIVEELESMESKLDGFDQVAKTYTGYQTLFNTDCHEFKELKTSKEKASKIKKTWSTIANWNAKFNVWMEGPFQELQVEEMDREMQTLFKEVYALHKKEGLPATEMLKDRVSDMRSMMPAVLDLGNPNIRSRHWDKIFKLIEQEYYPDMEFNLSHLVKHGVMNFKDQIGDISGIASGESQLEASLEKIQNAWSDTNFSVMNHRDQHNLFVLGSLEDIFTLLEDNQVTLMTMLGSRFIKTIQEDVEEWSKKLAVLSETLDEWLVCQKTWMYLENIFGAEDIQKQLPAESQKFLIVDRSWKVIMNRTNTDPLCLSALEPLDSGVLLLDQFNMNNAGE